jgi:hypothetical protein
MRFGSRCRCERSGAKSSSRRHRSIALSAALLLAAPAHRAAAQWGVWQADSLLASGRVAAAESLYYATSSVNPRDAAARGALGRYLAARGALRIGAVLLEEARLFGGDTAAIARALAPIYCGLGDYRALTVLPKSPLSRPERERATWLATHQQVLEFADSVAVLSYTPVADGSGLGAVTIIVGERRVDAVIDPRVSGIVLRGSAARARDGTRSFGADTFGAVAVATELHLGGVTLSNVPARRDTASARSTRKRADVMSLIGLDVIRKLAPSFAPDSQTLVLRRSGQISASTAGDRVPILFDETGLRLLLDGHWEPASDAGAARLLATRRWTLDVRRGAIVLQ